MRQFDFAPPADIHALGTRRKGTFHAIGTIGVESRTPVRRQMGRCNLPIWRRAARCHRQPLPGHMAGKVPLYLLAPLMMKVGSKVIERPVDAKHLTMAPSCATGGQQTRCAYGGKGTISPHCACGDERTLRCIHQSGVNGNDEDLHRRKSRGSRL